MKSKLLYTVVATVSVSVIFLSCDIEKNSIMPDPNSGGEIVAIIGNDSLDWKSVDGSGPGATPHYGVMITGNSDAVGAIQLSLSSNSSITTRSYLQDTANKTWAQIFYIAHNNLAYNSTDSTAIPLMITVDSISPTFIRGSFKGEVVEVNALVPDKKTITGHFAANLQ